MPAREPLRLARPAGYAAFFVAVATSLLFLHFPGTFDVATWLENRWLPNAERFGLIEGYARTRDNYPPLSFVVVGLVGPIADLCAVERFLVFKWILFLFLLASSGATWVATRSAWGAAGMHALLTVSSVMHGYLDILLAPFLILTCHCVRCSNLLLATLAFCVASMMKWQPLILTPFLLLHAAWGGGRTGDRRAVVRTLALHVAVPAALMVLTVLMVFGPWAVLSLGAATRHQWLSANALNLNWLFASAVAPEDPLGVRVGSSVVWQVLPRCLCAVAYGSSLLGHWRNRHEPQAWVVFGALGYLSYFMFNPGVHENHLFVAAILCWLTVVADPVRYWYLAFWPIAANVNHVLFYGFTGTGFPCRRDLGGVDLTCIFAAVNVLAFLATLVALHRSASHGARPGASAGSPTQ